MDEKLHELIERFQNGELTAAESASLEELLRAHPEARAEFVSSCLLEMQLYKAATLNADFAVRTAELPECGVRKAEYGTVRISNSALRNPKSALALAGLAAAILVAVSAWLWRQPEPGPAAGVIARVGDSAGQVVIADGQGVARAAVVGQEIVRGEKVRTEGEGSWASLDLADGTRVELGSDAAISFADPGNSENARVELEQGAIQVHAAKQPSDRPLVFSTAHASVIVLGTKFRLYKEEHASRVELEEGKVRLVRKIDGRAVEVAERSVAIAAARVGDEPLKPAPLSREAPLRYALPKAASKVAFSPDGTVLAGNRFGHGKTWSVADGKLLNSQSGLSDARFGLVFSPKGDALLSLSETKRFALTDARTLERKEWPLVERDGSRDGAISADGRWLAVGQVERKMLVWSIDPEGIKPRFTLQIKSNPNRVALSRELATGVPRLTYGQWNGPVEVLDLSHEPPTPVRQLKLASTAVALALSDDGQALATYCLGDGLQFWQISTGEKKDLWSSQAARIECLRFSGDGKFLAAGLNDGTARLWSTADGAMLLVLDAGCRIVRDVTFSPDGGLLATAGDNGQVKVWECALLARALSDPD